MWVENLVSTIIPVHNRPTLLREAVASVLAQTFRPIEIIIVDDGSTDETAGLADEISHTYDDVRTIHQANAGAGAAREAGRRLARGEFIQYLDSDDLLLPLKFELQVKALRDNTDYGVSYGKTRFVSADSTTADAAWKRTGECIATMFPSFLESRFWGTSTPLYRAAITDRAGPWLSLRNEEDWEYDCRIAKLGVKLAYCPNFVSVERDHAGPRLSRGGRAHRDVLESRAIAHELIFQHAKAASIPVTAPEMQHFARELFLLARQCGAAGLRDSARSLFELAKLASGEERANGWDFRLYSGAARILGWTVVGQWACALDRFRS
jgi:glycosyltransferase involved in cell wall biosynthesis